MAGAVIKKNGDTYFLEGSIDELVDLTPLKEASPPLKLNLAGISFCNSVGSRNFLNFIREWGDQEIEYYECSSAFIYNLNMIPLLLGVSKQGKVRSLHASFECSECDEEQTFLVTENAYSGQNLVAEELKRDCPSCGEAGGMELIDEGIFDFVHV